MKRATKVAFVVLIFELMSAAGPTLAVVVNFDDLPNHTVLTGTGYAGLLWEPGNTGFYGNQGYWLAGELGYPHSTPNFVMNAWGSTQIGIGFRGLVNVNGAYFAGQGNPSAWTTGVRVHGYRFGSEVALTDWFTEIDSDSDWFAMNLNSVDRIVIESVPVSEDGGTYSMDDFTYEPVPEPSSLAALALGLLPLSAALARRRKR
ncbi:MAG: PEP-CTERM sorting domain-containing protein [Armatimonadota bacterium]|nr:PEP-CTERM sorting domain-containing protein [Armatimonadota bacterium]